MGGWFWVDDTPASLELFTVECEAFQVDNKVGEVSIDFLSLCRDAGGFWKCVDGGGE